MIEVVDEYPNGDAATRTHVARVIESYTRGRYYFLQTSPRFSADVHTYMASYGLCKDEFTDNDNWPTQLYVREGRRMIGNYVMTESDVFVHPRSIGEGNCNMDSHIVQMVPMNESISSEGTIAVDYATYGATLLEPYPISYNALTPDPSQATKLLVSVTMSASNMAYRSLRAEPTYMIMGQAAGTAATLAIDQKVPVQSVSYPTLEGSLRDAGVLFSKGRRRGRIFPGSSTSSSP